MLWRIVRQTGAHTRLLSPPPPREAPARALPIRVRTRRLLHPFVHSEFTVSQSPAHLHRSADPDDDGRLRVANPSALLPFFSTPAPPPPHPPPPPPPPAAVGCCCCSCYYCCCCCYCYCCCSCSLTPPMDDQLTGNCQSCAVGLRAHADGGAPSAIQVGCFLLYMGPRRDARRRYAPRRNHAAQCPVPAVQAYANLANHAATDRFSHAPESSRQGSRVFDRGSTPDGVPQILRILWVKVGFPTSIGHTSEFPGCSICLVDLSFSCCLGK